MVFYTVPYNTELSWPGFHRTNGLFGRSGEEEEALTHPVKNVSSAVGSICDQGWEQQKSTDTKTNSKASVWPKWDTKSHYNSLLWILTDRSWFLYTDPLLLSWAPGPNHSSSQIFPKFMSSLPALQSFSYFTGSPLCNKLYAENIEINETRLLHEGVRQVEQDKHCSANIPHMYHGILRVHSNQGGWGFTDLVLNLKSTLPQTSPLHKMYAARISGSPRFPNSLSSWLPFASILLLTMKLILRNLGL